MKCTYTGIAKFCCNYISTDPFVGLLLDFEWLLGIFCYFDLNCCWKPLSSNHYWLFEYWKLESFFFNGFGRFKHRLYPLNWWGISFLRYINLPKNKYLLESIIIFFKRNYILRIITRYLVSVSCLTGICFFWCKDLQPGILDSLSKAIRRETLVKIVPKSSSPQLFSSCSHKVWMNHDPSL